MATLEEVYKRDLAHKRDYVVTSSGDLDTVTGLENYRDSLFRRLITTPGSLIHRPNYGVGIKMFQNSLNSIPQQQRLASRIKDQFERDPRTRRVIGVGVQSSDTTPELVKLVIRVESVGYGDLTFIFQPFGA
jgi:hypothetical protein